jgi:flagellar biosynthesis protein FliP
MERKNIVYSLLALSLIFVPFHNVFAEIQSLPLVIAQQSKNAVTYSLSIKIIALMTVFTVLPALLITLSAFTRIIIVFSILRQGLGIPNVPSNQILIGLSLIMTIYVMMPIINKIDEQALQPYMKNKIDEQQVFNISSGYLKSFLLKQTRKADLVTFANLSHTKNIKNSDYPLLVIMPAFITSELKTAFQIGFLILLPFLIIDLVIASVLMSIGMMMLSPMVISLPFKMLFFVLVDGWSLIVTSLVSSFRL